MISLTIISPQFKIQIKDYLRNKKLNLRASKFSSSAIKESKFIIIATPTNYDPEKDYFDTSSVEGVIKDVSNLEENPTIVIRSTMQLAL